MEKFFKLHLDSNRSRLNLWLLFQNDFDAVLIALNVDIDSAAKAAAANGQPQEEAKITCLEEASKNGKKRVQ